MNTVAKSHFCCYYVSSLRDTSVRTGRAYELWNNLVCCDTYRNRNLQGEYIHQYVYSPTDFNSCRHVLIFPTFEASQRYPAHCPSQVISPSSETTMQQYVKNGGAGTAIPSFRFASETLAPSSLARSRTVRRYLFQIPKA